MFTLTGNGVSPGAAKGKALIYIDVLYRDSELYAIDPTQVSDEQIRLETAISDVRRHLVIDAKQIESRLNRHSAEIFLAQEAMLADPSVVDEMKNVLQAERINAEQIVRSVFRLLARKFRDMNDTVLRERADDIDDLSRRLLLSLAGIHAHSLENLPPDTVLVARRLLPSDTVYLSRSRTVAVLAEFAGPAAHAALLARELGIPCVGGISGLLQSVHTGNDVLVDGTEGLVVINPDLQALLKYKQSLKKLNKRKELYIRNSHVERTVTSSGIDISVTANVRNRDDVELAMKFGADGIGLFRTEPFFLGVKHFPTDTEFADFLLNALHPAQGKHINIRLLDIGADKNPIYIHLPLESDPFLGRRGVRVLLDYPELLDAQLRALLEVSQQFEIGILIPMVTIDRDVIHVVELLHRLAAKAGINTLPRIGAMIETPAAALSITTLKHHVDFFSIGSNDLTQYTMAAGRENPLVMEYFMDDHSTLLRLIKIVVDEAGDTPVSLCGELAGRIDVISKLLETGIRSLSVSAGLVPEVKNAIRHSSLEL